MHLDSIGIMGALAGSLFIMFLSYKICKSKGARRYINVCCSRCCENRGSNSGRHEEVINISNVTKPTVVSINDALTEMEQMHGIRPKKTHQKPSAPELMIPSEEMNRYRVLQREVERARKEVMEDDP